MKDFLVIIIFFISFHTAYSKDEEPDSTKLSTFEEFIARLKFSKNIINKSFFEGSYAYLTESNKDSKLNADFSKLYSIELRYGFHRIDNTLADSALVYLASEFGFLGNISSHLKPGTNQYPPGVKSDAWRFGFGFGNGYGYKITTGSNLVLYHSGSINWTRIDYEPANLDDYTQRKLNLFNEEFRFGTSFEAGVNWQFSSMFCFKAGYEHAIVFPRYLFWKWVGSSAIELLLQRAFDYIAVDFIKTNPTLLPIINFVFKSAVSFALYELRRSDMNFPFSTTMPLNYDCFKAGIMIIVD